MEPNRSGVKASPAAEQSNRRYWAVLLFGGLIWGVTFSAAKIATEGGGHPIGLTVWQSLLGFLVLCGAILPRGRRIPLSARHLGFYAVCGFFGTALPGVLYFYAALYLSAGVLSITLATVPILTLVIAFGIGHERPVFSRAFGIFMGILGIAMIVLPDTSLPDRSVVPWVLVAVVCALCYAVENMIIAMRMPDGIDAMTVLCGMLAMGTLMTASTAYVTDSFYFPVYPFTQVEWAVLVMAFVNVIAYAMFIYLVSSAGPVFASQMAYIVTLSGIAWGIALFDEQHSVWIWAALVVLMAGVALVKPQSDDEAT